MNRLVFLCLAAAVTVCNVRTAAADIYQWEFDPACSCYKPSTVLAPDGAGASAAPSANLSNRNLTKAYLHLADLSESNLSNTNLTQVLATRALFINANLTNANLQQGNLERAYFVGANLTGANFADADVRHATFFRNSASPGTSISTNQFYSTASYQAHNLTGVTFTGDFSGWNFANQNLNGATFDFATNVTGASFAGAQIQGTFFGHETISAAQLYTTASYQARNLSGIRFDLANLSGWNFSQQNLTGATFIQNTLTNTDFRDANLSNAGISAYWLDADFRRANLTNALLQAVSGTDAILTDAKVTGAALYGITLAQLYSTASYQANDLGAIKLYADLTDADFSGRTLSNAAFNSKLTNANFSNADLTNADFTSSVLTGANFFQANLSGANFYAADLTGANFTNANVDGADFARYIPVGDNHPTCGFCSGPGVPRGGINLQQIYSSASYQSGDLSGIRLEYNNLVGADFAGINLSGAVLIGASLIDANLTNANVSGVDIALTAIHGVDARGAQSFNLPNLPDVVFNTIEADGHIEGVTLTDSTSLAYRRLLIRDYDGDPSRNIGPISIQVEEHFDMSAGGKLQMRFEADAWNSTISFNSGIPVSLGGTLELSFVEGVSLAGQVGRTFDVFDWTGVTPTGTFTVESAYVWELTNLYTTGEVTLLAIPGLPGDFNQDGAVDAADCIVWRKNPGGIYTEDDYNTWRASYGRVVIGSAESQTPVPEPEATFLLVLGAVTGFWSLRPIIFARSNTSVRVTRGNKRPKYKLLAYGTSTWSHNSVRLERRRSPAGANPILPIGRSGDINRSDKAVATSEGKNVAGRS